MVRMQHKAIKEHIHAFCTLLKESEGLDGIDAWCQDLQALGQRIAQKPDDLNFILLFGPTGCGKSKLTNSLIRHSLTPVGYRRPTTVNPYFIVPKGRTGDVVSGLPPLPYETEEIDAGDGPAMVLIDAPDIDSVREENHALADAFLRFADAILVVVTEQKYADDSIWQYITAFAEKKRLFHVVLNKFQNQEVLDDLREKLDDHGIDVPILTIPMEQTRDHELLAETDDLASLRGLLETWAAEPSVRRNALRNMTEWQRERLNQALLPAVKSGIQTQSALLEKLAGAVDAQTQALEQGLPLDIDKQTQKQIYKKLIQRLDRIDPLRYPRKILSFPFRWVKGMLPWPARKEEADQDIAAVWDLNEETFVNLAMTLHMDLVGILEEAGHPLPAERTEAELRREFSRFQESFKESVAAQAEAIASRLSLGQKVKFYTAQVLIFGAVIGLEAQTGGLFTLTEVLADGLVSPFAAKLIGMAISSEESRQFHEKSRAEYLAGLCNCLKDFTTPFTQSLTSSIERLETLAREGDALAQCLSRLENSHDRR